MIQTPLVFTVSPIILIRVPIILPTTPMILVDVYQFYTISSSVLIGAPIVLTRTHVILTGVFPIFDENSYDFERVSYGFDRRSNVFWRDIIWFQQLSYHYNRTTTDFQKAEINLDWEPQLISRINGL